MTNRERILAALRFGVVDAVPWAPRWELWFNAASRDGRLPERYRGWPIHDVARDLGMGIKGYGLKPFAEDTGCVPARRWLDGDDSVLEYATPFGTLTQVTRNTAELAAAGVRGRVMKEFISDRADYDAAMYVVEHTRLVPRHEQVAADLAGIGDDGVGLAFLGHAPAHLVMREWTGYEGFYYQLQDNGPQVERLIQALDEQQQQLVQIAVDSPARVMEFDGNYDGWLTPPPVYRRYFLPAHRRMTDACHAAGKIVASHCDGRNDGLLDLILESGFDVAEAFTPPPMTNIGVGAARAAWGRRVTIWGGLAATAFTQQFSEEEFDAHVWQTLSETGDGRGLALGTGDNVPTDGSLERIIRVGSLVGEWSRAHMGRGG
ncbi:MAG: uroporphyrinogen decarboxylase family protein [Anaerolineae bacterium]